MHERDYTGGVPDFKSKTQHNKINFYIQNISFSRSDSDSFAWSHRLSNSNYDPEEHTRENMSDNKYRAWNVTKSASDAPDTEIGDEISVTAPKTRAQ